MARLSIQLLGAFRVALGGEFITTFESDKVRALLAYLAVEGDRPHRREKLVGLLWPNWPERSARANLTQALYNLRRVIRDRETEPPFLLVSSQTIQFNRESDHVLDVALLTGLGEGASQAQLENALAACGGPFLAGFSLPDSSPFEEWVTATREQLGRLSLEVAHRLAAHHEVRGEYQLALRHARRGVELEPTWEWGHRTVMRALALSGERNAALAQYEACRRILDQELEVEPAEETRLLFELLSRGEKPAPVAAVPPLPDRPPRAVGTCPYRGLAAFREDDAPFFYGRDGFVDRLSEAVHHRPLVAVIVGSSGSGKTSAVRAGLVPRLRAQGDWLVVLLRPGSHPFQALAAALLPLLEPGLDETDRLIQARKLGAALRQEQVPLLDVVERALEKRSEAERVLLVVDQFEELYTLCPDFEEQRRYLDLLLAAVEPCRRRAPALVVLLTLRADFMGQALAHRPLADALQEGSLMLGPLTRGELRAAIEKPAEVQGAAFEEGLVERILDDVGLEPGSLPLLEFALTLLWERHDYGWLTHEGYEKIGRVAGALTQHADQVYGELDEADQGRARRVFVQLVRPGEGTDDTRRIATWAELGDGNWGLVQHLADRRLVVTGRDAAGHETAEVVHEALIQRWGQLRSWMDSDRAFRSWQERLRAALRAWEGAGRDEGALLRGTPLAEAEEWLTERRSELSPAEVGYIEAGMAQRDRSQAEHESRRRRTVLALGGGLVAALILLLLAGFQWRRATTALGREAAQREIAISRELAAAALSTLETDPELSVLLALQALARAGTVEAENALHRAVPAVHLLQAMRVHDPWMWDMAVSRDGARMATTGLSSDGYPVYGVWDISSGRQLLSVTGLGLGQAVAISPDGFRFASYLVDGTVVVWDIASNSRLASILAGDGDSLAFSPDGKHLATGGMDGDARIWDAVTGELIITLHGGNPDATSLEWPDQWRVTDVAFSPDGSRLATAGADGDVEVWELAAGEGVEPLTLSGRYGPILRVAFRPDGTQLATASEGQLTKVWDLAPGLAQGQPLLTLSHGDTVAYSLDGTRLATAEPDGTVNVWDADSGRNLLTLKSQDWILHIEFDRQGTGLITAGHEGWVRVWDPSPDRELLTLAAGGLPAFSPDGRRLATGGFDGAVGVWDLASGEQLLALSGHTEGVSVAFSPDGTRLATVSGDGTAKMWDAASGEELFTLRHSPDVPVPSIRHAFSPDGKRLATCSTDGTATVWDATTGEKLLTLVGIGFSHCAFSPDGVSLATADLAGAVTAWDATSGEVLFSFTDTDIVESTSRRLAFSPDGRRLAAVDWEGTICIWDITTPEWPRVHTLKVHTGRVTGIAYSPAGDRLATTGMDGTTRVWDAGSGQELLALVHHHEVVGPAFSPDGKHLAVGSTDGTTYIYTLDLEELRALARDRVTRSLTDEECRQYLHLDGCPGSP